MVCGILWSEFGWDAFATMFTGVLAVGGAFWVGRKQTQISAQQNNILGRQADAMAQQTEIMDRQAKTADRQTEILAAQAAGQDASEERQASNRARQLEIMAGQVETAALQNKILNRQAKIQLSENRIALFERRTNVYQAIFDYIAHSIAGELGEPADKAEAAYYRALHQAIFLFSDDVNNKLRERGDNAGQLFAMRYNLAEEEKYSTANLPPLKKQVLDQKNKVRGHLTDLKWVIQKETKLYVN